MKWYQFDATKGSKQKRPPIGMYVLVKLANFGVGMPDSVVVGYRKDAACDKQCPYFVTPGAYVGEPYAWCDCLPDGFDWPQATQKPSTIHMRFSCPVCIGEREFYPVATNGATECECAKGHRFLYDWHLRVTSPNSTEQEES